MALNQNYTAVVQVKVSDVALKSQLNNIKPKPINLKVRIDNGKIGELKDDVKQLGTEAKNTKLELDKLNSSLNNSSKETKKLGNDFVATIGKVAKFYVVTQIIQAFTNTMSESIEIVKEFDSALTDFKKVSDLSGESLDNYTKKLGELGTEVARTRSEMVSAATEFRKSGFTDEDSAQLAKTSSLYQNVADSELSAGDASAYVISQMKAFNITANDAISIIDKTNEVSNNFAVSSTDISSALTKTSSSLAAYGNDIDHTIALVTAGTEIMTGQASKVGRGLRSIGANISKMAAEADSFDITVNGVKKTIDLFNQSTGEMRNTYDVLEDISENWDEMSNAEKSSLAITLANKTQIDVFTSVLSNFGTAQEAVVKSLNSSGSAMKENEKYMESLEAKTQAFKSQLSELVLGDGGLSKFIKNIVDLGTKILEFANNDLGQVIIKITAFIAVTSLAEKAISKLIESFITKNATDVFMSAITSLIKGEATLTQVTEGLTGAMSVNPIFIGLAVYAGAMILVNNHINKINDSIKELTASLNEIVPEAEKLRSLEEPSQAEIDRLAYLEKRIELEEQLLEKRKQQQVFDDTGSFVVDPTDVVTYGGVENIPKKQEEKMKPQAITDMAAEYAKLNQQIKEWSDGSEKGLEKLEALYNKSAEYRSALENEKNALIKIKEEQGYLGKTQEERLSYLDGIIGKTEQENDVVEKQSEELDIVAESYNLTAEQIQAVKEYMDEFNVSATEAAEALNYGAVSAEEASQAYQNSISTLSSMESNFQTLNGAIKEYNSNNGLTLDTLSQLLSMDDEYLSLLEIENGQMSLNQEGALALANAKIDEAEASAYSAAMSELETVSVDNLNKAKSDGVSAANSSISANNSAIGGINAAISACNSGVKAWNAYWTAESKGRYGVSSSGNTSADIGKALNTKLKALEGVRKGLGRVTTATSKATKASGGHTKATKNNTSAVDENKKALEAQLKVLQAQKKELESQKKEIEDSIKDYETVIDYIKDKVKDYIDSIETQRDAELNAIQKEIDALEEKADAEEQYWDDKIKALEEQNDALDDQIERQKLLDALQAARNKKVKVYREGRGFVYETDETEVSKAQQALDEYDRKRKYEEQLRELEDFKNKAKANYDQQIKDLQALNDSVKKKYDDQIAYYDNWIKDFDKQVNHYKEEQARQLAIQYAGIDMEQAGWQTRLNNLNNFVNGYNNALAKLTSKNNEIDQLTAQINALQNSINNLSTNKLGEISTALANTQGQISAVQGSLSGFTNQTEEDNRYAVFEILYKSQDLKKIQSETNRMKQSNPKMDIGYTSYGGNGWYVIYTKVNTNMTSSQASARAYELNSAAKGSKTYGFKRFASGVSAIDSNQVAIVGENPNKEIVLGSNVNNGTLMNLQKGSGVVNATSTKTLAGILNSLGKFGLSNTQSIVNNNQSQPFIIENVTIDGANITDISSFKNALMSMKLEAMQRAYKPT